LATKSTGEFIATDKGTEIYNSDIPLSTQQARILGHIIEGVDTPLNRSQTKGLEGLLKKGYIQEIGKVPIETLVGKVSGPFRKDLETYVRIAKGKVVSNTEVESLKHSLLRRLKAIPNNPADADYRVVPKKLLSDLSSAHTRSEKIIAIDSSINFLHSSGIFRDGLMVLNRLRYGK
jgi:hypothetical protein